MSQQFYTVAQAAMVLQISKITIWRKIKSGEISSVRLGRRVLIPNEFFERLKGKAFSENLQPQGTTYWKAETENRIGLLHCWKF